MTDDLRGGFRWVKLGFHHCLADEDGRVLAHIVGANPKAPQRPVIAYVDGTQYGLYLSLDQAKTAIEEVIVYRERHAIADVGKAV